MLSLAIACYRLLSLAIACYRLLSLAVGLGIDFSVTRERGKPKNPPKMAPNLKNVLEYGFCIQTLRHIFCPIDHLIIDKKVKLIYNIHIEIEKRIIKMNLIQAEKIALRLIDKHLTGWVFAWNNRVRTNGLCNYTTKTIYLSKKTTEVRAALDVLNTITHEIAHALTPGESHSNIWKAKHKELGGNGQTCSTDSAEVLPKWVMISPNGAIVKKWYRKPNKSTFAKLATTFLTKDKLGTLGKLKIIPYSA